MTTLTKLAGNVRRLRKRYRMPLLALARETGLAYNAVWKLEQGSGDRVQLRTVMLLAEALRVPIEELVGKRWR